MALSRRDNSQNKRREKNRLASFPLVVPTDKTYRNVTYRLIPGTRAKARDLARTAGAARYVWNRILADQQHLYQIARIFGGKPPSVSFATLGKAFTELRRCTPWLRELPYAPIRYTLKHQAHAWQRYFRGQAGRPQFKGRGGDDSITIPENVRIRAGKLHFPRIGPMVLRRRGGNPYADGVPVHRTVKRVLGKWYATVCYSVNACDVALEDNGLAVGVDMNAGQVATSTGDILRHPDVSRIEARRRRYQRRMARCQKGSVRRRKYRHPAAKTNRRIALVRSTWQHGVSRVLADTAGLTVVEDRHVRSVTRTAKGTVDAPGANVRQKAGLNRVILNTGWGGLCRKEEYKTAVEVVKAAYTSQTCHACGCVDAANRRSQARCHCVGCAHEANADVNAALNILASGTGATGGRGGAVVLATPMSR